MSVHSTLTMPKPPKDSAGLVGIDHIVTPTIHGVTLLVIVPMTPSSRVLSDHAPNLDEPVTRALIS